jgi:hypothetical protein
MRILGKIKATLLATMPFSAQASQAAAQSHETMVQLGVSGIWFLANISYAGMRAQSNPKKDWRIIAFLFGIPGTFVTYLAVKEGSERAYGIDIPKKQDPNNLD